MAEVLRKFNVAIDLWCHCNKINDDENKMVFSYFDEDDQPVFRCSICKACITCVVNGDG
jgi:hypothetical protein